MDNLKLAESRSSSRDKNLPLSGPADEDEDVFIPLEETMDQITDIVDNKRGYVTFIRAPVASGKTTLAKHLAAKREEKFVMVSVVANEGTITRNIIRASGIQGTNSTLLEDALKALASSNKTLILDEAHIIFSMPNLSFNLFKAPEQWQKLKPPKILLFSAASEGQDDQGTPTATPAEIRKKFMWYPTMPDEKILSDSLAAADVYLHPESVDFFMKICSGNRGIFMKAMQWVQEIQQESKDPWNVHESVSRVKSSFTRSKGYRNGWQLGLRGYMIESRAVCVKGNYSTLTNIPDEFAQVVFGGPRKKIDLGGNAWPLTISGFLVPERNRNGDEFVRYNWDVPNQRFGVANSVMAEYYGDIFSSVLGYQRAFTQKTPQTAADLMARALPFMSFATVIDNPLPGDESRAPMSQSTTELKLPLSNDVLPYEDHYNDAVAAVLNSLGYAVSRPENKTTGKTDVVVTFDGSKTCALEAIMATRPRSAHIEHASRFGNPSKSNYSNATLKGLITIGSDKQTVLNRLNGASGTTADGKSGGIAGLEAIGLVVSAAHDSYDMYVRPSLLEDKIQGPFFLVCDRVAKSLDPDAATEEDCVIAANQLQIPKKRSHHQDTVLTNSPQKTLKTD